MFQGAERSAGFVQRDLLVDFERTDLPVDAIPGVIPEPHACLLFSSAASSVRWPSGTVHTHFQFAQVCFGGENFLGERPFRLFWVLDGAAKCANAGYGIAPGDMTCGIGTNS